MVDTCLPPRKRYITGFNKDNSCDMRTRLRDLLIAFFSGSNLSTNEIVEASVSAALAAAAAAAKPQVSAETAPEELVTSSSSVEKPPANDGNLNKPVPVETPKRGDDARSALELPQVYHTRSKTPTTSHSKLQNRKKHILKKIVAYSGRLSPDVDSELDKVETMVEPDEKASKTDNSQVISACANGDPETVVEPDDKASKYSKTENSEMISLHANGEPDIVLQLDCRASKSAKTDNSEMTSLHANGGLQTVVRHDGKSSKCSEMENPEMISLHPNGGTESSHATVQVLKDEVSTGRKQGVEKKKLSVNLNTDTVHQNTEKLKPKRQKLVKEPNRKFTTYGQESTVKPSSGAQVSHDAVSTRKHKGWSGPQTYLGKGILGPLCSNPNVTISTPTLCKPPHIPVLRTHYFVTSPTIWPAPPPPAYLLKASIPPSSDCFTSGTQANGRSVPILSKAAIAPPAWRDREVGIPRSMSQIHLSNLKITNPTRRVLGQRERRDRERQGLSSQKEIPVANQEKTISPIPSFINHNSDQNPEHCLAPLSGAQVSRATTILKNSTSKRSLAQRQRRERERNTKSVLGKESSSLKG